jgi:membrane-associated phospholipid phosphatase
MPSFVLAPLFRAALPLALALFGAGKARAQAVEAPADSVAAAAPRISPAPLASPDSASTETVSVDVRGQGGFGRREVVGAAALLGTAFLLDGTADDAVPEGGGERLEPVTRVLNHMGRPLNALALLGGTWVVAQVADRPGLARSAEHVTVALVASGVVNGALKYGVGRERPGTAADPHEYSPFNPDNGFQSFPSGHTVVAFSLAAAVAEEARNPWVSGAAYGAAALVGWSRVYDDKHWASDVVGGAIVGVAVSKASLRWLHRNGRHGEGAGPTLTVLPGGLGVSVPAP